MRAGPRQTGAVMDHALGPFLRNRREAVSPSEVGLPTGKRRRTPGLRRAELATLAGISVDYLIRLEQGRDRRPSAQVLAALADALLHGFASRGRVEECPWCDTLGLVDGDGGFEFCTHPPDHDAG